MRISELVEKLEDARSEHGDIHVFVETKKAGAFLVMEVLDEALLEDKPSIITLLT